MKLALLGGGGGVNRETTSLGWVLSKCKSFDCRVSLKAGLHSDISINISISSVNRE